VPTILITGVSSGLGQALALRAHAAGWHVFGTVQDERSPSEYGLPTDLSLYRLALRFPNAVSAFSKRFIVDYGAPDVLVNNAQHVVSASVEETSAESLRDTFQVNAFAAMDLANAVIPAMRQRGTGTIVNITSLGGRVAFPRSAVQNASEHALEGFSEGLWHELKPFGIRVKVIESGYAERDIDGSEDERAGQDAADQVWAAIMDPSDRLRYPVAAHARSLFLSRRFLGDQRFVRRMHRRWLGDDR
jgi:NAD(P)-dependent dehydrogenase (short-subunit alcohol dehydrogenase family)